MRLAVLLRLGDYSLMWSFRSDKKCAPNAREQSNTIYTVADVNCVEIIKEGVDAWNQWRTSNCGVHFSDAFLRAADLTGAVLNSADLTGADLDGAEVEFTDFRSVSDPPSEGGGERFSPLTRGLTAERIKAAKHWERAYYDDDLLKALGLAPDHNAITEKEQRQRIQRLGQAVADSTNSPADEDSSNAIHKGTKQ